CDFYRSDCKPTHPGTYAARRRHLVRASNSTAIAATCLVTQQYVSKLVSALAPDASYNNSKMVASNHDLAQNGSWLVGFQHLPTQGATRAEELPGRFAEVGRV